MLRRIVSPSEKGWIVMDIKDIKAIVSRMTLEEKCSMLGGKSFWETMDIERLSIPAAFLAVGLFAGVIASTISVKKHLNV